MTPTDAREVVHPRIGRNVYIAPTSVVCGEVTLGDDCVIMHHVLIRGDVSAITIGRGCNIQDGTVVHTKTGEPLDVADEVAVGHRAVVHCRRVGRRSLIGIGAIVLDDAEIGEESVIGAGALVPPGKIIPPRSLVMGVPGRVIRSVTDEDLKYVEFVLNNYRRLAVEHAAGKWAMAPTA
ncbi:MAG: gamma carbonic anhydrase family protein [Phycisphaerales bacterium]|nr:gamma carbonic anhydrase family protein [Phycisphaerales bacterium]